MTHNCYIVRAFGAFIALTFSCAACVSGGDDPSRGQAGAAGSSSLGGAGGSANIEGCYPVELESLSASMVPGWVQAKASGKDLSDALLRIELNNRPGYPASGGLFDLSTSPDDDYATCAHCVVLMDGAADPIDADRVFFQVDGTFDVESVPNSREWSGSITSVKLVEVELDPTTYELTQVADGACYTVAEAAWDTRVPLGAACDTAEDCGDPGSKVCDPSTAKCIEAVCDGANQLCPADQICLAQSFESNAGACYDGCDPMADACGSDRTCRVVHFDQSQGVCVRAGTAAEGNACEPSDVTTGCTQGLVCAAEFAGHVCREPCDFLTSQASCPSGQVCVAGSFCSDGAVDPAPIDTLCDSAAPEANPCGMGGGVARGVCVLESGGNGIVMMCRRVCRMSEATDCAGGQTCYDYFGTTGVCR